MGAPRLPISESTAVTFVISRPVPVFFSVNLYVIVLPTLTPFIGVPVELVVPTVLNGFPEESNACFVGTVLTLQVMKFPVVKSLIVAVADGELRVSIKILLKHMLWNNLVASIPTSKNWFSSKQLVFDFEQTSLAGNGPGEIVVPPLAIPQIGPLSGPFMQVTANVVGFPKEPVASLPFHLKTFICPTVPPMVNSTVTSSSPS